MSSCSSGSWLELCSSMCLSSIPGTRKLERLDENIAAAAIQLTADDFAAIAPLCAAAPWAATQPSACC